jgi:hypothetical protein
MVMHKSAQDHRDMHKHMHMHMCKHYIGWHCIALHLLIQLAMHLQQHAQDHAQSQLHAEAQAQAQAHANAHVHALHWVTMHCITFAGHLKAKAHLCKSLPLPGYYEQPACGGHVLPPWVWQGG